MPWDLKYLPQDETVLVTHTGPLSAADARDHSDAVIAQLKATTANRVLIDHSRASGSIPAADIASLPDYYRDLNAPTDRRFALVMPRSEEARHTAVYHKVLCDEKGYAISLFQSRALAQLWLSETAPSQPSPPPAP